MAKSRRVVFLCTGLVSIVVATVDRLPPIGNLFVAVGEPVRLFAADGTTSAIRIVSVRYTPLK